MSNETQPYVTKVTATNQRTLPLPSTDVPQANGFERHVISHCSSSVSTKDLFCPFVFQLTAKRGRVTFCGYNHGFVGGIASEGRQHGDIVTVIS